MVETLQIEPGKKYACTFKDRFGYATYSKSLDCVSFHTWEKHFKTSDNRDKGHCIVVSPVWIGRPKNIIAGYTILREWTAEDEHAFQQEGRTRRDLLNAGLEGYQPSLF